MVQLDVGDRSQSYYSTDWGVLHPNKWDERIIF